MANVDDTGALWQEFRKTGDRAVRDRLILTYAPLVKFVAGRLWAAEVVVLDTCAHGFCPGHRFLCLLEVVLGLACGKFSDRQHGNDLHPLTR